LQKFIIKHVLDIELKSDTPDVKVDRDKFEQVLSNLLENAIKYNPQGGKVSLAAVRDEAKQRVMISITHQGLGISLQDQQLIFKTFHRIHRTETQGVKGSGLGLYIVKDWIKAMGGEVWLKSELNKGSLRVKILFILHIWITIIILY
jgi:signal transduction histidine kinase